MGAASKKVGAALPVDVFSFDEAEVDLVDESGSLQGVARGFARHVTVCGATELFVDERSELFEGLLVARAPCLEESTEIVGWLGRHEIRQRKRGAEE